MPLYLILHYCVTIKLSLRLWFHDYGGKKAQPQFSFLNFITVDVVLLC